MPSSERSRNVARLRTSACLPLVVLIAACANRPIPPRISLDELVLQALAHSTAHKGGDENLIHRPMPETIINETWHPDQPATTGSPPPPIPPPIETLPRPVDASAALDTTIPSYATASSPPSLSLPGDALPIPSRETNVPATDPSTTILPVAFNQAIRLTEEFIETDIREALTTLALQAEVDLILDDNVTGIVNTRIDNLTIDEAIEKLIMPLGYASARRGEQVIVAEPVPESPLFSYVSVKRQYQPMHLDVKTLMETVPRAEIPFVTQIEQAKTLLIEAPPAIADRLIARFELIDQPVPQVVLEAIICVVAPDSGFQFGLDWRHAVELDGAESLAISATGLALNGKVSGGGLQQVFSDFSSTSAFVKLLCEHGYLTIRATPHVMAKDGEQANISISRETFFSIQPPGSTGDNAVFFQQQIQKVDAGIMLDITPHIRGDVVTVDIEKAEVSEDVRTANTELSLNPFPIINRRSVSTTVSVRDGKTIVIGGLVQRETVDRVNKIPGLSRLPLIGGFFQTTQRQSRDAEVVIFISPRIVRGTHAVCLTP